MQTLIRSGAIDVIVVDSVAALVSRQELDGQMGDTTVGLQARMMSQAMRRLTAAISKTNCVCIFTNQIREKIGVMFGSPETTPGGRALKFFCSVRMDIRRIGQIKEANGTVTGSRTRLKIVKNKVAPPFTACEFDIMYNEGISKTGSVIDSGLTTNTCKKVLGHLRAILLSKREAAKQTLTENPEMMEKDCTIMGSTSISWISIGS